MRKLSPLTLLLLLLPLLLSCSEDDAAASYRFDYADMTTTPSGRADKLLLDDGNTLKIQNDYATQRPSQTFRVYAASEQLATGVRLVNYAEVLTDVPHKFDESKVKTDPVDVVSVWHGGRYVNFILGLKTGASAHRHAFSIIDDGITTDAEGIKTLHLRLYHNQNGDDMSYTRKVAFSCNIDSQKPLLGSDYKIEVVVNTFKGNEVFELAVL